MHFLPRTLYSLVEAMYDEFVDKITSVTNSHVPSRMLGKKNMTPWINRKVKRLQKKKTKSLQFLP